MPNGSEELTDQRKNEIISACEKLYQSKGFKDITIKDISVETTFSRPSIYNYFETKEEIFLALLEREYAEWTADLGRISAANKILTREAFAEKIAGTLGRRTTLFRISAMNLYEIEENSRLERLVQFKKTFKAAADAFMLCVKKCLPDCGRAKQNEIRYAFFPFMNGLYPYTHPTDKQCEAMKQAGISFDVQPVEKLVRRFLRQILK